MKGFEPITRHGMQLPLTAAGFLHLQPLTRERRRPGGPMEASPVAEDAAAQHVDHIMVAAPLARHLATACRLIFNIPAAPPVQSGDAAILF